MLEALISFIGSIMISFVGCYIIENITEKKTKVLTFKNILIFLIYAILIALIHYSSYSILYSFINFILYILVYKEIFKIDIVSSFISCGIFIFIIFISDLLVTIIMLLFVSPESIRGIWYIYLLTNILVCLVMFLSIKIKPLAELTKSLYKSIINKSISNFLFLMLLLIGVGSLAYNITTTTVLNADYFINGLILITISLLAYLFFKNNMAYNELSTEYDSLFVYVQNFEDWIEQEQITRHEYKNQLAMIYCLTKDKKVKEKINEILNDNIKIEGEVVHQLKILPKGGIKGIMYYKASIAQKSKLDLTVSVSLLPKSLLSKLKEKDMRVLCKLVGIYFDNAIEAAKETKKKALTVEIYEFPDRVNLVFSNSFKKHENFDRRNEKGVSSKGKGHGNGLYFANKLISKSDCLDQKQEIIDKYYIQELTIFKDAEAKRKFNEHKKDSKEN